jgi:ribosomal-protein-alanine N-acetyltransferase
VNRLALRTTRLELRPLPPAAAGALPDDRETAERLLGAALSTDWPQPDLLDILPMQAAAAPSGERFGVWVIIERGSTTVVGDVGFMGPPGEDGGVEIGYCVTPGRRGRGYAGEAVHALVAWALTQPGVGSVAARCDVQNVPSIRVLERAGFVRSGENDGQIHWRLEANSLRV